MVCFGLCAIIQLHLINSNISDFKIFFSSSGKDNHRLLFAYSHIGIIKSSQIVEDAEHIECRTGCGETCFIRVATGAMMTAICLYCSVCIAVSHNIVDNIVALMRIFLLYQGFQYRLRKSRQQGVARHKYLIRPRVGTTRQL